MNETKKNYVFVKNGKLTRSLSGARKITSLKNPAIEEFYDYDNISLLKGALDTIIFHEEKYQQVKKNDYVPEHTIDVNNECYSTPRLASQLVGRPHEVETLERIRKCFPNPETQDKIIACKNRQLIHTLAFWAKKTQAMWLNVFGHSKPGLFSEKLLPYTR